MKIYFNINFNTKIGEQVQLVIIEKEDQERIYPLYYTDNGNWRCEVDYFSKELRYRYLITGEHGEVLDREYADHQITLVHNYSEYRIYDSWNLKNFPENYLNNKIFKNRQRNFKPQKTKILKKHTHLFRIEAPLYDSDHQLVLLGNVPALGQWEYLKTLPMLEESPGVWQIAVEIPEDQFIQYKYGIMNVLTGKVFDVEYGKDRWALPNLEPNVLQIQNDHYFRFKSKDLYRAAGVAVPVFSLRSENGFGVGEFQDLKLVADWSKNAGLSVIQTLPINDTTANYTWTDSYPYAPISLYALHPIYISIERLKYSLNSELEKEYTKKKEELNQSKSVDYDSVIEYKWRFLRALFEENKTDILQSKSFKKFIKENKQWLEPYSAFCLLRDKYSTPNFNEWKTHRKYIPGKLSSLFRPGNKSYEEVMLHQWVQFELDRQLSDAIDYAHSLNVSMKGDLPIGIYRYSVEAWTEPELYGMDFQAGAPPDQFTQLGQNWGFPTYNWEAMKNDGYRWWKSRFKALEKYFDAMRIDHILGFFRIWRIPYSATQGILGYFYPAHPITELELHQRGIHFNYDRFCKPQINDQVLWDYFGERKDAVHNQFMHNHFNGTYTMKEEFSTQRKLVDYFAENPWGDLEERLISLLANVLLLAEEREGELVYHPRFNLQQTDSFRYLSYHEQRALDSLYNDYFFSRQEQLWYDSAMEKLPAILNSTEMLICGEDLGLVPKCVPQVMDRLAITALKVQRMPSDNVLWYDPKQVSYLNVVTASSHDSSTLRQWWNDNRELTQKYFNEQLGQWGTAPYELVPELAEIIMLQHLYNESMLSIFPIQEFFATDYTLANPNLEDERINDPANFPHYWKYRMHLNLEDLVGQEDFNRKIAHWVEDSGRSARS